MLDGKNGKMTNEKVSALIRKVRALRQKTEENGCTEAEAITAASLAARILEEYDISLADVNKAENADECRQETMKKRKKIHPAFKYCGVSIGKLCQVEVWKDNGATPMFFGYPNDVEVAKYLLAVCMVAMDGDWSTYMDKRMADGQKISMKIHASFMAGMGCRLSKRIKDLDWERRKKAKGTGSNALVVADKMLVIREELNKQLPSLNLEPGRTNRFYGDADAIRAGGAAADKVGLHRGVDGREQARIE